MQSAPSLPSPQLRTLIVVLGMHRSGTSVTTRAMETMGASFGDNLMPPAAGNNPKGFFEDLDVSRLNIELMQAAGVDWHAPPAPDLDRLTSTQRRDFKDRALALLREKCQTGIFALKDPRIARLLPFWQPVFEALDVRVLYVVAFRHPISVVRSLEARDSLPVEKSYLLWLTHVVPALRYTANRQRAIVNYDCMMEAPRASLQRLAAELNLSLDPGRLDAFESDFLDDGLRHTRFTGADLAGVDRAPTALKSLFNSLEIFASEPSASNKHRLDETLKCAETFLADIAPLLARDWQFELQSNQSSLRINELERELTLAPTRAADDIAVLEQKQQSSQALIEALERRCTELEGARIDMQATIKSLEHAQSVIKAAASEQRGELSHLAATLNAVLGSTSWRVTAPLRAVRRSLSR
ncbi:hypothetical protein [Paraburkholderia sp. J8-2]|uniref:sulfotransferase family protein n=1 Tax=Paraburkholderia sp. J8-2 TaxID=2805440 RepID=UPI002AB75269|nr:hypothetical protein [Paraburkholderia sp. J8-2]